jgi:hypothetical protein
VVERGGEESTIEADLVVHGAGRVPGNHRSAITADISHADSSPPSKAPAPPRAERSAAD